MSEKREYIIESATRMIRAGGYNAFSFREIAEEVGIKSSSVHHYFRRKEDLARVVAGRYCDAFFAALGDAGTVKEDPKSIITHYGNVFLHAFKESGKACLCGILTHESPAIPQPVLLEIESFVDKNIQWLMTAYGVSSSDTSQDEALARARATYTAFNGAMAVATLKQDVSWIESIQSFLQTQ